MNELAVSIYFLYLFFKILVMEKTLVLATGNKHKLREFQEMLEPIGYKVLTMKDIGISVDPEENGKTYGENAYIKCKAVAELCSYPVISDDSGIELLGLGRFPGIFSSRFVIDECEGSYENAFVVINERLKGLDRRAEYHCSICYLENKDAQPVIFDGICAGYMLDVPNGHGGFGYDPMFHCYENDKDFGVCSEDEKNAVSHRRKALEKFLDYLKAREHK